MRLDGVFAMPSLEPRSRGETPWGTGTDCRQSSQRQSRPSVFFHGATPLSSPPSLFISSSPPPTPVATTTGTSTVDHLEPPEDAIPRSDKHATAQRLELHALDPANFHELAYDPSRPHDTPQRFDQAVVLSVADAFGPFAPPSRTASAHHVGPMGDSRLRFLEPLDEWHHFARSRSLSRCWGITCSYLTHHFVCIVPCLLSVESCLLCCLYQDLVLVAEDAVLDAARLLGVSLLSFAP